MSRTATGSQPVLAQHLVELGLDADAGVDDHALLAGAGRDDVAVGAERLRREARRRARRAAPSTGSSGLADEPGDEGQGTGGPSGDLPTLAPRPCRRARRREQEGFAWSRRAPVGASSPGRATSATSSGGRRSSARRGAGAASPSSAPSPSRSSRCWRGARGGSSSTRTRTTSRPPPTPTTTAAAGSCVFTPGGEAARPVSGVPSAEPSLGGGWTATITINGQPRHRHARRGGGTLRGGIPAVPRRPGLLRRDDAATGSRRARHSRCCSAGTRRARDRAARATRSATEVAPTATYPRRHARHGQRRRVPTAASSSSSTGTPLH